MESPIARIVDERRRRKRLRPAFPGLRRQLAGVGLVVLVVVGLDLVSKHVVFIPNLGLYHFFTILLVSGWAGLPAGLVGCGILVAHVWIVYHYPITPYGPLVSIYERKELTPGRDLRGTAITFPIYAAFAGVVHYLLIRAATRTFDAQQNAETAASGLRTSEEMRRLIVDASPDAVVVFDEGGAITHWNPNARALFGWRPDEAVAARLDDLLAPATPLADGRAKRLETKARTKDGRRIDIEATVVPHPDGAVVAFLRDIGERKRAEAAIREMNELLEKRVARRTAELEAANGELTGFNYSVSHDLRTPLRGIVGNIRILLEDGAEGLDEEALERLRRIEAAALKMGQLIESLLQFSRVGQVALKEREFDLSAAMAAIVEELRAGVGGEAAIEPGMTVCGDPDLLYLVALNLLENAWKYVRKGEAPRVEAGRTPDGAFFVRDRGIGFDMEYVEKIWKPFERLHRDEDYPGTGIGLANCRRIVRRHGGEMWAESKEGKGTTVYFTLPRGARAPSREGARAPQ